MNETACKHTLSKYYSIIKDISPYITFLA